MLDSYFIFSDNFTTVWFLIDFFLNFNTGYFYKGVLIMNRKQIAINYLKKWFIFDLLASFPYEWIMLSEIGTLDTDSVILIYFLTI